MNDISIGSRNPRLTSYNIRKARGIDGRQDPARVIDVLVALEAAVEPEAGPTAILGDFSEWSATRGLDALHEGFSVIAPGKSFHAALTTAALDRIAPSRGIGFVDAGVVKTLQSLKASDHLPVCANIALPHGPDARAFAAFRFRAG